MTDSSKSALKILAAALVVLVASGGVLWTKRDLLFPRRQLQIQQQEEPAPASPIRELVTANLLTRDNPLGRAPLVPSATLLIAPESNGDRVSQEALDRLSMFTHHWLQNMPPELAVIPVEVINRELWMRNPLRDRCPCDGHADTIEGIKTLFSPTHVLSLELVEDDQAWIYNLRLAVGEETRTGTVSIQRGDVLGAGAAIAGWSLDTGLFSFDPKAIERLRRPYFGGLVQTAGEAIDMARHDDFDSPSWHRLAALNGYDDLYQMNRSLAVVLRDDRDGMIDILERPYSNDPAVAEFLAKLRIVIHVEEFQEFAIPVLADTLAHYPGHLGVVNDNVTRDSHYDNDQQAMRDLFTNWRTRMPAMAWGDLAVARAYVNAGWAVRGTSTIFNIPAEALAQFEADMQVSAQLLERIYVSSGRHPDVASLLFSVYGTWSGVSRRGLEIFEETIAVWPHHHGIWRGYFNYSMPRWGGDRQAVYLMAERMLAEEQLSVGFVRGYRQFHAHEMVLGQQQSLPRQQLTSAYWAMHPDFQEQTRTVLQRSLEPGLPDNLVAFAIETASQFGLEGLIHNAATTRDDLYDIYEMWVGYDEAHKMAARWHLVVGYIHARNWDLARRMIGDYVAMDDQIRDGDLTACCRPFVNRQEVLALITLVEAMAGNHDRALELAAAISNPGTLGAYIDVARVHIWRDGEAISDVVQTKLAQNPADRTNNRLMAVVLAKQERYDEARELWWRVTNEEDTVWGPLQVAFDTAMAESGG